MNVIDLLEREQQKPEVPVLRTGDTVRVHVKVVEGTRERIQVFEGIVIGISGKMGPATRFTVRRISHGVGVERTFLLHSPRLDRIDVLRHGDVRRAKLFYLRGKVGKHARVRERRQPIGGGGAVIRPTALQGGAPEAEPDLIADEELDEARADAAEEILEGQEMPEGEVKAAARAGREASEAEAGVSNE
jgi:large subunit ribosomal protein L19